MKKLLCYLMTIITLSSVVSCGGDNKNSNSETPKDKYAEVPLQYTKQTAKSEDSELNLYFAHSFDAIYQANTKSTNRDSYKMYMAKNETETMQFLLSSQKQKQDLSVNLSSFKNDSGDEIAVKLYYAYYFDTSFGTVGDAMVPYTAGEPITIEANKSQAFYLEAKTESNTKAGLYKTELEIFDEFDNQIKLAEVYLNVWDFALPESFSMDTAMDLSSDSIFNSYRALNKQDKFTNETYKNYYDFLLDYGVSSYNLPYSITTDEGKAYLDDPRVTTFNAGYSMSNADIEGISKNVEIIKQKPEWEEKAYFYYVDEPLEDDDLDRIKVAGEMLSGIYEDYRMVSPFFINGYHENSQKSWLDFMEEYINVWCCKPENYTTGEDVGVIGATTPFFSYEESLKYGTMQNYMNEQEKQGDTIWWYTCVGPRNPYITLNADEKGSNQRVLFWQQKLYDVDGFLYFMTNYWHNTSSWELLQSIDDSSVYGDGWLIYSGIKFDLEVPVASIRLNNVRDGIEDFEYLTMLSKVNGDEYVDDLIKEITTSVVSYKTDSEFFASYRVRLGNLLEDIL